MSWFSRARERPQRPFALRTTASRSIDGRGFVWLGGVPLDLKFGFRMLVKYPGLTIVGGLAMAFAVWTGSMVFEVVTQLINPTLTLPGGDRIVQIRNWDAATGQVNTRALSDFVVWRDGLKSVTDLGVYRDLSVNLAAAGGEARPVQLAEITASAFRIAPSVPLLGRTLAPSDERAGAPPVVVLGHDVWQTRFGGDAGVIGRSVQLGETYATVVGVMPQGFAFPVFHEAWIPLQSDLLNQLPRQGPPVTVFGRLASGVSLDQAQVELSVIGERRAAQQPDTHKELRPRVMSYARAYWDLSAADARIMSSFNLFAVMFLVLICSNVALLMFARAASRESELAVRSALGASRGRIIAQLFAEALVLGAVASVVGLAATDFVLSRWGVAFLEENLGTLPFWYDLRLSPITVFYAAGLTLLGAAIAGVLPALKIMRGLGSRLRQGTAGGGGVQFGGVWTAVIIAQVAFTVAFPAVALLEQIELSRVRSYPAGFAAEKYLAAVLEIDPPSVVAGGPSPAADSAWAATSARFSAALETVRQRVAAEPGVVGVTFVDRLPRTPHPEFDFELDQPVAEAGAPAASVSGDAPLREVKAAQIDPSYFNVLETTILAGRGFHAGDLAPDSRAVIVDRSFVDRVLLGRNAIGRRVRFAQQMRSGDATGDARPWYEIVGVVNDLGMAAATEWERGAGLYFPVAPGMSGPLNIVVHAQGDPMSLAPRLRAIAAAVDPALKLSELQRVDRVTDGEEWLLKLWLRITLVLTGIALMLALAGIYSVLSFTVARRTREIGIRRALGSDRRSVVAAIFRRPLTQVSLGVAAGGALIGVGGFLIATRGIADGAVKVTFTVGQGAMLVAYAAFMLGVCLLACIVPTRRALRVEPTEALRAE